MSADRLIADVASRQDGVVTRAQLLAAGVPRGAIDRRIAAGRLCVLYRGVFAVGHAAISDRGRIRAALLAVGARAMASHSTAGFLHSLIPTLPAVLHVTVPGRAGRSRPGLVIHESQRPTEVRHHRGFPVTAPLRTLQDLGFPEGPTREALARRLIRPEDVPAGGTILTRSELERRMLRLIRAAALPDPLVNHAIGPYVIDFAWPEHGVLVEADGWATHGYRAAFERDRARDAHLATLAATLSRRSRAPVRSPS